MPFIEKAASQGSTRLTLKWVNLELPLYLERTGALTFSAMSLYLQYLLATKKYVFPVSSSKTAASIFFTLLGKPKDL